MKTCKCSGRARCAYCVISVREERGVWFWGRAPRNGGRRTLGYFTGRISLDGASIVPFAGPRDLLSLCDLVLEPGTQVSYYLVDSDESSSPSR